MVVQVEAVVVVVPMMKVAIVGPQAQEVVPDQHQAPAQRVVLKVVVVVGQVQIVKAIVVVVVIAEVAVVVEAIVEVIVVVVAAVIQMILIPDQNQNPKKAKNLPNKFSINKY